MKLTVRPVELSFVHQALNNGANKFIALGVLANQSTHELYSYANAVQYLTLGQWELFVAVDENNVIQGAATITYANYPKERVAFITALGGKGVVNIDVFGQLQYYLSKFRGVTLIQAWCSGALERLYRRVNLKAANIKLVEIKL